jgi:hypothetical protein
LLRRHGQRDRIKRRARCAREGYGIDLFCEIWWISVPAKGGSWLALKDAPMT